MSYLGVDLVGSMDDLNVLQRSKQGEVLRRDQAECGMARKFESLGPKNNAALYSVDSASSMR